MPTGSATRRLKSCSIGSPVIFVRASANSSDKDTPRPLVEPGVFSSVRIKLLRSFGRCDRLAQDASCRFCEQSDQERHGRRYGDEAATESSPGTNRANHSSGLFRESRRRGITVSVGRRGSFTPTARTAMERLRNNFLVWTLRTGASRWNRRKQRQPSGRSPLPPFPLWTHFRLALGRIGLETPSVGFNKQAMVNQQIDSSSPGPLSLWTSIAAPTTSRVMPEAFVNLAWMTRPFGNRADRGNKEIISVISVDSCSIRPHQPFNVSSRARPSDGEVIFESSL